MQNYINKFNFLCLIFCKAKNIAPALGGKAARGVRAGAKHPKRVGMLHRFDDYGFSIKEFNKIT